MAGLPSSSGRGLSNHESLGMPQGAGARRRCTPGLRSLAQNFNAGTPVNPEQALDYLGTISLLTTRFGGKRVEGTQQAAGRQFYGAASGAGTGGVIEQSGGVRI